MSLFGGGNATLAQINEVPMPVQTDTYQPVSHLKLVQTVQEITQDVLPVELQKAEYKLASDGQHLFAHMRFKALMGFSDAAGMGMSVGIVNSYNKRLKVQIASGAEVMVCSNLMVTGDIHFMRKHTGTVWEDIAAAVAANIATSEERFDAAVIARNTLSDRELSDAEAHSIVGRLYGEHMLTNPMISKVRDQWITPDHEEFQPRTQWSLYNAVTEAYKLAQPGDALQRYQRLHNFFMDTAEDGFNLSNMN